ncbi:putative MATE family efflux protein [Catenibacillus scindens]|uniref:Probable multidrug resistance protein NorM n=1 Tax=Catenibacillus scindens TaxID=673271 RepID=A0A7W8HAQ2_9FIRM|nr:MATE family efflux transporter [Catenibacillus scindens]MBB5264795.1 putative MATE family efflux protein [Catenibacillus scindens]
MGTAQKTAKASFFTKDKAFYKAVFSMMIVVALQNLVAYSVNMADNIMLGGYDQNSLSGASTVNQIFFMVQQVALAIGNSLVVLASQYWGENRVEPIRTLTGIALKLGLICSVIIVGICVIFPRPLLMLFTSDEAIIQEGLDYLALIQWTFVLFIISNILMAALRSVGTVKISFYTSVVSLIVNVGINYTLIFGHFGFPEMGVRGAAIGTLVARILELGIVVIYLIKVDKKLSLFSGGLFKVNKSLRKDYRKVTVPVMLSQVLWGVSVPMQTAILGHLSADAIAANSVATTFYQYLKVIVIAMSSTSSVMIGNAIGRGNMERIKSDARTLAVINVLIGLVLGIVLFSLRYPLLSMYKLSDTATDLAINLIAIMSVIMVGMSYQMPVSYGIIQGGGDAKFNMAMNMISTWVIVMPLSFMAAFWWKLPVELVVLCIQSDQLFKGIPSFIRFRSYKWIKKLTKPVEPAAADTNS